MNARSHPAAGSTAHAAGAVRLSWDRVLAWRLARHHLVGRAPAGALVDVAGAVCGLHAQLSSSAELSALARDRGAPTG